MNVECQNQNPYIYPETARFFQLAIQDKAYMRMQFDPHYDSLSGRELRWGIFLSYLFTPLSLRDIAPLYNLKTGARVHQIIKNMAQKLYLAVSEDVLTNLPSFESLRLGKPQAVFGRKISQGRNGLSFRVSEHLRPGMSYGDVLDMPGVTPLQLAGIRKVVKKWGQEIPYKTSPEALQKRNNILEDPGSSDSKVDAVLSGLSAGQAHHLIKKGLLLSVRNVVFEAGHHFYYQPNCLEPFLKALKRRGIPIGYASAEVRTKGRIVNQRHHFIAANHYDRAVAALLASRKLKKYRQNPVQQVAGPDAASLPATTNLVLKRGFESVGKLVLELGGRINSRTRLCDILDQNCPMPIFVSKRGYFYPADQEEALRIYLQGRLAALASLA